MYTMLQSDFIFKNTCSFLFCIKCYVRKFMELKMLLNDYAGDIVNCLVWKIGFFLTITVYSSGLYHIK